MRALLPALGLLCLLAAVPVIEAHHRWRWDPCHTDVPELTVTLPDGSVVYVVVEHQAAVFVYLETNGLIGLQRWDSFHRDANGACPPDTPLP